MEMEPKKMGYHYDTRRCKEFFCLRINLCDNLKYDPTVGWLGVRVCLRFLEASPKHFHKKKSGFGHV